MLSYSKYRLASLCTAWCLFNIFFAEGIINSVPWPNLPAVLGFYIYGIGFVMLVVGPFIYGSIEFDRLGKELTIAEDLRGTLVNLSPLVLVYFGLIVLIWNPADGDLVAALGYTIQNPNWWQLGVWAVVIYYTASGTVKRPYGHVITALLGLLASQHLLQMYNWYRLDDGCYKDMDGYVDCDDSYVQTLDRVIEEATSIGITHESLMAAELYIMLACSLIGYVVIALIKDRFFA